MLKAVFLWNYGFTVMMIVSAVAQVNRERFLRQGEQSDN
jgi:hypothetical protein